MTEFTADELSQLASVCEHKARETERLIRAGGLQAVGYVDDTEKLRALARKCYRISDEQRLAATPG